jgi:hypothetical protein
MEEQNLQTSNDNINFQNKEVFFKEIDVYISNNPLMFNKKRKNPYDYVRTVKPYRQNKTQRTIYGDEIVIDLTTLKYKHEMFLKNYK